MSPKRVLKAVTGRFLYGTGLFRSLLRGKGVVVLFHRVDDTIPPNPISCTTTFFRHFCAMARRHFDVVGLGDLLDRIDRGDDVEGRMAITFDDGYADNLVNAAPILMDFGLPACFFISTDFIGSDRIPWWDVEWGVESRWMTWDQVRELRRLGHEIGAHTCNHVDLGKVAGAEAQREIEESKQALEDQLGEAVDLFSYPYGRIDQITEENRDLVRQAGLRCCPSAYGGPVRAGDDPYYLLRQPISPWHVHPYQFAFEFLRE